MNLEEAADQLYGVPPDRFMALRTELVAAARAGKDAALAKEIGALRKPSVTAWAVNLLVRERPQDMEGLVDVGERLRRAQATGAGGELRELGRERTRLVDELARLASTVAAAAGQQISASADREVRETLTAALASPAAADAVASGCLTRALSYAGLGEVDVSDAAAGGLRLLRGGRSDESPDGGGAGKSSQGSGGSGRATAKQSASEARAQAAEKRLKEAERSADKAAEALAAASGRLQEATGQLEETQSQVDALEEQLEEARERLMRLTTERGRAARAHRDAEQAARAAIIELEGARGGA